MAAPIKYSPCITLSLGVKNLAASLKWYQEILGFKLIYEVPGMGWAEVTSNVDNVSIGMSEVENPQILGGATIVFAVDDIEAARGELEGRGVRFDGDTIEIPEMVKLATFFDGDGHKLMFSQNLAVGASH